MHRKHPVAIRRQRDRHRGNHVVHQCVRLRPMEQTRGVAIIVTIATKLCKPAYTFAPLAFSHEVSLSSHFASLTGRGALQVVFGRRWWRDVRFSSVVAVAVPSVRSRGHRLVSRSRRITIYGTAVTSHASRATQFTQLLRHTEFQGLLLTTPRS